MPDPATIERLRGLILSATEIKAMTNWPAPMIEDYLTLFENIVELATLLDIEIDQPLEDIPTEFGDGSIPFAFDGFLNEDNPGLTWLLDVLNVVGVIASSGRQRNKTSVSFIDTPYTVLISDEDIFIDTDSGDVEILLLPGIGSGDIKIINSGESTNLALITPNSTELLFGENEVFSLYDSEIIETSYSDPEGWY